jgi:zinc transporter ZupT
MGARGWGVLVALGAVLGAAVGVGLGEPSAGLLLGLGAGAAAAALLSRQGGSRR